MNSESFDFNSSGEGNGGFCSMCGIERRFA